MESYEFYGNPIITKTGEERIFSWYNTHLYDNDGAIIGTFSSGEDITELTQSKKNLEELVKIKTKELRESEEKYRLISENANDLIAVMNSKFQHEYINEGAYFKILGYTREDLLGKEPWALIHPEDLAQMENIEEIFAQRIDILDDDFKVQHRLKHKKGHYIWVESTNKVFNGSDGKLKIISITRDITNHKEAEEKLKKSEREKDIILKSISELIAYQDLDNTIIWANQAAGDSLGKHPDELIGKKCYQLWQRSNKRCQNCPIKIVIETGLTQSGEIISPGGRIWFIKGFPVKDENGDLIGVVEVTSEITKLKKAEEKVNEAFKRMNLYRNLFAHDINNIFSNIKMASELCGLYLNDPNKLEELHKLYQVIEEQIIRGNKLIKNVQRLTSLEEEEFLIKKENISQILKDSLKFLKTSFPNREIDIITKDIKKNLFVQVNELLVDVFENILFNAVIHNRSPKVEIEILVNKSTIASKNFIKIEFKDNGIGISDKRKKTIFKIQKDIGKRERGLGLGLSLVKKIIDSYDGKIRVENRVKANYKKGSNFIVLIPEA